MVLELGFSKEIKYIHVSQIIYCKKLAHVIVKADKYQHLYLASWKLRRAIMWFQSKDREKKETNKTMSQLKTVKQEKIPLTCVIQTFNWLDEAHAQNEGTLLYLGCWFKCYSYPWHLQRNTQNNIWPMSGCFHGLVKLTIKLTIVVLNGLSLISHTARDRLILLLFVNMLGCVSFEISHDWTFSFIEVLFYFATIILKHGMSSVDSLVSLYRVNQTQMGVPALFCIL